MHNSTALRITAVTAHVVSTFIQSQQNNSRKMHKLRRILYNLSKFCTLNVCTFLKQLRRNSRRLPRKGVALVRVWAKVRRRPLLWKKNLRGRILNLLNSTYRCSNVKISDYPCSRPFKTNRKPPCKLLRRLKGSRRKPSCNNKQRYHWRRKRPRRIRLASSRHENQSAFTTKQHFKCVLHTTTFFI